MEAPASLIEPLLERAEQYGKTSFELLKLRFVDRIADVASTFISRLLLAVVFSFFAIILNIAIALWLGDLLGKYYYGFFVVASFYGAIGIILLAISPTIKEQVSDEIITKMLK